jgi:hypothetical protein
VSLKHPKRKGSSFELKICKILDDWWGKVGAFNRSPHSGAYHTITKGAGSGQLSGDIVGPQGFLLSIEAKKRENWDFVDLASGKHTGIMAWWGQAVKQTPPGKEPVLIFSKNRTDIFVMISIESLKKISSGAIDYSFAILFNKFIILRLKEFLSNIDKNCLISGG